MPSRNAFVYLFRFRISGQLLRAHGPGLLALGMISVFMVLFDAYADEGNCNFAAGCDGRIPPYNCPGINTQNGGLPEKRVNMA